jgi:hypothetical protein
MKKKELMDEITNFIEYYTSDDAERIKMGDTLIDYMLDVYESPAKNVRFVRKPDSVLVRMDNMPEFKILPSESESYQKQFLELGYTIYIS